MRKPFIVQHLADFSAFLKSAFGNLLAGFERLVAIEFDAPWRRADAGGR